MRRSMILDVCVQAEFHTLLLISLFMLFSGHNQPGGGFPGGLVAASAFCLRYVAGGRKELDRSVIVAPTTAHGGRDAARHQHRGDLADPRPRVPRDGDPRTWTSRSSARCTRRRCCSSTPASTWWCSGMVVHADAGAGLARATTPSSTPLPEATSRTGLDPGRPTSRRSKP